MLLVLVQLGIQSVVFYAGLDGLINRYRQFRAGSKMVIGFRKPLILNRRRHCTRHFEARLAFVINDVGDASLCIW
jgi:hypothetical protein